MNTSILRTAFLLAVLLPLACTSGPRPIHYDGTEACAHCRMALTDTRYGGEAVSRTGKVYVYDSVACMAAHQAAVAAEATEVQSLWVVDFMHPGELIPVGEAFFLQSDLLHSPMGLNLTAFGREMRPESALNSFGGAILSWDQVLATAPRHGRVGAAIVGLEGEAQR